MFYRSGYVFFLLLLLAVAADAKSLLYEVRSKNSTVYILGSIHLAKPELYPLEKAIEEGYKKSDVLVVEVDTQSGEAGQVMQYTMRTLGAYPQGKSLRTELSPKTYRALQAYTEKAGLPLYALEQMRPWVVMLQLSMAEMQRLGYSPELGIDKHFLERAKREEKTVLELETIQQQMAFLSRDDKQYQDDLLRYSLASMHEMEPMLRALANSWKNGDAKAMEKLFLLPLQDDADLKDIYERLVIKRNRKMTKKIESFLKTGNDYFVVVGAGHVVGKEGIVELLAGDGYRVIQK